MAGSGSPSPPGGCRGAGVNTLAPLLYRDLVRLTLTEDLGRAGDLTTHAVILACSRAKAHLVARQAGCIAGLAVAEEAFRQLDAG
ncbi:MAG: hypothetical protein KDD47_10515, partial [Acidobacteria bacterium]|nr:hypothetical protein [Acidobacteriota bacterium]